MSDPTLPRKARSQAEQSRLTKASAWSFLGEANKLREAYPAPGGAHAEKLADELDHLRTLAMRAYKRAARVQALLSASPTP